MVASSQLKSMSSNISDIFSLFPFHYASFLKATALIIFNVNNVRAWLCGLGDFLKHMGNQSGNQVR